MGDLKSNTTVALVFQLSYHGQIRRSSRVRPRRDKKGINLMKKVIFTV